MNKYKDNGRRKVVVNAKADDLLHESQMETFLHELRQSGLYGCFYFTLRLGLLWHDFFDVMRALTWHDFFDID